MPKMYISLPEHVGIKSRYKVLHITTDVFIPMDRYAYFEEWSKGGNLALPGVFSDKRKSFFILPKFLLLP